MIIKNLFRRYERWNPVHPTYGAFWGMGIGIGCGIGWGPGFGPEVIGYVGAGCGAGFSVGITFLGLGIGLPANYLIQLPYSGFMITRSWGARAAGDISSHHNPFPTISNWRENIIECGRKHITDCFRRLRGTNVRRVLDSIKTTPLRASPTVPLNCIFRAIWAKFLLQPDLYPVL